MRPFTLRGALVSGLVVLGARGAGAQAAPAIKLAPAEKKLEQEFSSIVAMRELSDGRVLVADLTENKLVVADFAKGSVTQIGRAGQGPGEYQNPRWLYRLSGDSTLLVEQRTARWHLLAGASLVSTVPADNPVYSAFSRQALGADGRGHLIRTSAAVAGGAGRSASVPAAGPDSTWLLRIDRSNAHVDTLGRLKAQKAEIRTTTNAKGELVGVQVFMAAFSAPEQPALFEDGWLAIARMEPYRIEWIAPDGKVTKGRPIPWPAMKISREDIEFLYSGRGARGPGVANVSPEVLRKQVDDALKSAPDALPPFTVGGLIPAEDGTLLIRHNDTAGQPNARYDLADRSGTLRGTIAMPKGQTIVAVTRKWAYVVSTDDDGLQYLSRHPWSSKAVAP